MTRRRLTVAVGLLLSVALLSWALRDVSVPELLQHVRRANPWWLAGAAAMSTCTFVLRAIRWKILLKPAVEDVPFRPRFAAVCIGFMANNLLPLRLGEFARAYSLSRIVRVGMSATFASLVVERLFDAIVLIILLLPAVLVPGVQDVGPITVRQVLVFGIALVGTGLVVLGVLVRFPSRFLRFAERWSHRVLPRAGADRVTGVLTSFIAGLGALRHAHVFAPAIAWSFVIWIWNAFSFFLGFLAFGILRPGVMGALLLQSVIGFAVSIPSSPGFFGPFEAAARVALSLYGVDPTHIISFAAGYHILSFIPVTVIGLWYMHRLGISRDELGHSEEYVEAAVEERDAAPVESGAGP
ncbi:MAG: lysylphosphatidylglycerol synthase transmembrane domain-containing protein [Gemmatimonadota bacterium]